MDEMRKPLDEIMADPNTLKQLPGIIKEITADLSTKAERAAECIRRLAFNVAAACGSMFSMKIRNNLTRKQYHLYRHGRPRVRKKWENAAIRRAKKAERRKNHV